MRGENMKTTIYFVTYKVLSSQYTGSELHRTLGVDGVPRQDGNSTVHLILCHFDQSTPFIYKHHAQRWSLGRTKQLCNDDNFR